MFFLLPILIFVALAVNSLASPYASWPIRARNEVGSLRVRKEEFRIHSRTESAHRNFSLPLSPQQQQQQQQESRDDSLVDERHKRTLSSLNLQNLEFPQGARNEDDDTSTRYNATTTTSTIPVRPRNAFAIRPRFRPGQKTESLSSALIQHLATRQSNDSSDDPSNSTTVIGPGNPMSGLSATIPNTPGFNATIFSFNGTDITSNFKIMFYRSPEIVALDELNGKKHKKRQTGVGERLQNKCLSSTAIFHYSHCTPKGSVSGTTRTFQVWCRERSKSVSGSVRPIRIPATGAGGRAKIIMHDTYGYRPRPEPPGMCAEDELCMDSVVPWVENLPDSAVYQVARCVSTRLFKQLPSTNDLHALTRSTGGVAGWSMDDLANLEGGSGSGEIEPGSSSNYNYQGASSSNQDLAGSRMSMRLTSVDERPLPANVEVDLGRTSSSDSQGSIENHPCRAPCMDMSTTGFPVNTNWVSAHSRLVTALTFAGVMWVAFFH